MKNPMQNAASTLMALVGSDPNDFLSKIFTPEERDSYVSGMLEVVHRATYEFGGDFIGNLPESRQAEIKKILLDIPGFELAAKRAEKAYRDGG